MADDIEPTEHKYTARKCLLRGVAGLFVGLVVGAVLGAVVLMLLYGWGNYTRDLASNRPAGIVGAAGTDSTFAQALTFAFAFWGAVIGAPVGFLVGLFRALGKMDSRTRSLP